jgi:putative ABC transport system ATP-binding protein
VSAWAIPVSEPGILLLDEATSSLDDNTQRDVERLVCELIRDGELTALIVTHDGDQARRVAQRVMVTESGRLVDLDPVKEGLGAAVEVLHTNRSD